MDESNRPRMSTAELLGTTGTWEDSVVGCIVAEVSNRSGVRLGVVSNDAARTIRATVVSPAGSDSRLLLLIPQWYMIALTLNYLEQRERAGETSSAHGAPVGG